MKRSAPLSIAFFVFVLLLFFYLYIQFEKLKPIYDYQLISDKVSSEVNIGWDENGVIHITGKEDRDVIFASGYAAAKERLWQMELTRRLAKGQLSEIFGDTTLIVDKLFLTIDLDSLTKALYPNLSPQSQFWLQWYADGINEYLNSSVSSLPIEFSLMDVTPQKWTPQDCLLQNRILAWFLNFNWRADALFLYLKSKLPPRKFQEIFPGWQGPDIINAEASSHGRFLGTLNTVNRLLAEKMNYHSLHWGSNNWVVGPSKSKNGAAMLANDPHLTLQFPALWIEMHLKSDDMEVGGFGLPGTPGIIIGRNQNIAWGVTNGMIDDSDYFIVNLDTINYRYHREGKSGPLQQVKKIIKVKDRPDLLYTYWRTANGPVMNSVLEKIPTDEALELNWTGFRVDSDELLTFIRLAKARNWAEFKTALSTYVAPCQNFVFAGKNGDIGYRLAGQVPQRNYSEGLIPKRKGRWTGFIPFSKMPEIFNPSIGWIATANNRITSEYYLTELWEPPYRSERISELLLSDSLLDDRDMQRIQMDIVDSLASQVVPLIIDELKKSKFKLAHRDEYRLILENWNCEMSGKQIAPTLYMITTHNLLRNIFADELGEEAFLALVDMPNFYLRIFASILADKQSPWWDNIKTSKIEKHSEIIRTSFENTISQLTDEFSEDMSDWEWGKYYQFELQHSLGAHPVTGAVFNRGPYQMSGSPVTVNVATAKYSEPQKIVVGPSLRYLMNWHVPNEYKSILPGGNSGHFLSKFYDNQIRAWLEGNIKIVKFNNNNSIQNIKIKNENN